MCMSECFSMIILLISPGRVVIDGIMNQRVVRLGRVQEHRTVALKERVAAAAAAVVIYYHDCWRDALFLTWEQLRFVFQTGLYTFKAPLLCWGLVFNHTADLDSLSSTAVGYIVDLKQDTTGKNCVFMHCSILKIWLSLHAVDKTSKAHI